MGELILAKVDGEDCLSLNGEIDLIRGQIQASIDAGKYAAVGSLQKSMSTLMNCQVRLDDFRVVPKSEVLVMALAMVDRVNRICNELGLEYNAEETKSRIRDTVTRTKNEDSDPLRAIELKKSRRKPKLSDESAET